MHSEKKEYQNGASWVLLLQIVYETVPLSQWGTKIVPLRVPYYGQSNSAPSGTISVPFFSECGDPGTIMYTHIASRSNSFEDHAALNT